MRDFMDTLRAGGVPGAKHSLAARSSAFAAELDKWWLESQRKINPVMKIYSLFISDSCYSTNIVTLVPLCKLLFTFMRCTS